MIIGLIKSPKFNQQYQEVIKKLGHHHKLLDLEKDNWTEKFKILDRQVDLYFWHSIDRGMYYRSAILDPLYFITQNSKHKIFPDFNQYYFYNDKIKQTNIFNYYNIPTLKTFYYRDKQASLKFIQKTKYPFVLKDPHSASSLGVYLVKDKKQAAEFIKKIFSSQGLNNLYCQFYAQEFIPDLDRSLRVITVGNKVYCAYWRMSQDDWRHRSDSTAIISDKNIPPPAKKICLNLAKKLKFHWMSWDLLVSNNKFYLIEFSCNFGTAGAEKLGYHPKQAIIKYIIRNK